MPRPWDRLDARDYVRLQESLLIEAVRHFIYPFSPFYRQVFDDAGLKPSHIRRLRDIQSIPITSAADFERMTDDDWRPFRALLRPEERSLRRWGQRSLLRRVTKEKLVRGDQAAERILAEEFKPVHLHPSRRGPLVGYTIRDLSGLAQAGARAMAVLGTRRSDVLVSTLPYGPDLGFWQAYYGAIGAGMSAFHLGAGETFRPSEAAQWMERVGMSVLVAQPGYAEGLLRGAAPATFARLRVLALWAPTVMQGARERFLIRLRSGGGSEAAVGSLLGVPEARVAWAECPTPSGQPEASNGYHTYPDLELLEVVDDDGVSLGENEPGELVYTSLDWRGSALLRYRTGIVARRGITWDPCPGCGRTVPRIAPDVSRVEWQARVLGSRGEVSVDVADVLPTLWRASGVPLWQLELVRGGGDGGTDLLYAHLGGAIEQDAQEIQRALAPYGVRCRLVPLAELSRRMGVGLERQETRVRIRDARP